MGEMYEIKYKNDEPRASIETRDIVGKKVLDRNGKKVGEIGAIHIHPRRLSVEGIRVKKGVRQMDDFISKNYIRTLNDEGAMLKITPVEELIGLRVYDSNGRKVGEVKKVNRARNTNRITTMIVHKGLLKKDMRVSHKNIKEIGKNVTLKIAVREK